MFEVSKINIDMNLEDKLNIFGYSRVFYRRWLMAAKVFKALCYHTPPLIGRESQGAEEWEQRKSYISVLFKVRRP